MTTGLLNSAGVSLFFNCVSVEIGKDVQLTPGGLSSSEVKSYKAQSLCSVPCKAHRS